MTLEANKQAEIDDRERSLAEGKPESFRKPFGRPWEPRYFVKWATIATALERLGVPEGAEILDVGMGTGWTSAFLAESGYRPTGVDIAPGNIEFATRRATRWGVDASFELGDMESFDLGRTFDFVLLFDALHHSVRPERVVATLARHVKPGGWVLFGEPSVLHGISPGARAATRDLGWVEKGISVRALKGHCAAAGLHAEYRRFFEGADPYESRGKGFAWQLVRLIAANVAFAPQASVWLAARKTG